MKKYMLDTNIVSYLIRKHPVVAQYIATLPIRATCLSVITEAELLLGLAKRPGAKSLHIVVKELLRCVDVLPWKTSTAECYADIRASLSNRGKTLSALDLLIAAHAKSVNAVLITNDNAFKQVDEFKVEYLSIE